LLDAAQALGFKAAQSTNELTSREMIGPVMFLQP
jgi:hypothetical protein